MRSISARRDRRRPVRKSPGSRANAKCAIVTDANVAPLYLERVRREPRRRRPRGDRDRLPAGRIHQILRRVRAGVGRADRGPHRAARHRRRARRRRHRRSRRLLRGVAQARRALRPDPDHAARRRSIPASAARPGSTRRTARTSSAPSISLPWCSPTSGVLDTLSPREFRAGYAEVVKYGLIGDRIFFDFLEARWREVFSRRPGAVGGDRGQLRGQGARRRRRRDGAGRARAAQSRPHLRPRVREPGPLRFRPPRPWRGRGRRHGLRLPLLARARPLLRAGRGRASRRI